MLFSKSKTGLISAEQALPGRSEAIETADVHHVFDRPLKADIPDGFEEVFFGMGCFWGAERLFWQTPGVWTTAVGYQGGHTPNPTYREVCSGQTAHAETVRVVFDPSTISFADVLKVFWEGHDPTQGMRQGNDVGSQYRSAIYTTTADQALDALASRDAYASALANAGHPDITTEIKDAPEFYYAEADHQQYLSKIPHGYCGLGGTGVSCPTGLAFET
ncbi:MAG: peptide-methionine (S)-S-oxide reductase MsrA [Pseudomonadota bacterium]